MGFQRRFRRFCRYAGECGSVKTCIVAYFMQCSSILAVSLIPVVEKILLVVITFSLF